MSHRLHHSRRRDELGMTTAEYAVGTLGAATVGVCGFKVIVPSIERLLRDPPPGVVRDLIGLFGWLDLTRLFPW
ncbi:DUF4244 domain-containing protein [Aeromicrobium sp. IC_218]|uniref:DUF4244 domain-containing protein n=1 Tax=Aeromicrobium sp. IC_218 TaxID=2545468 RepID=UPI00103F1347|nr:DUF4244 domain-containing protein [Aeromicrobium sp. IC_218]TCI96866.1 DUF4244 domain-containing protein [Aeromicrobium sp. IC_218]